MEKIITQIINNSIQTKELVLKNLTKEIENSANILTNTIKDNNKILVCGNGGSAADAQHFATELLMKFEKERRSLPALSLTTNTSAITAHSNDYHFDEIFQRQIESLGNQGDTIVGITTSGNSENIIKAFQTAKEKGLKTICLNGKDGGKMNDLNLDSNLVVPSDNTARTQESHITIIHIWCKLIEENT